MIPTPDASQPFPEYEKFYARTYQVPKAYVKFSAQMDDYVGCPYCLDEIDDAFLANWKSSEALEEIPSDDLFEIYMYTFERFGGERLHVADVPTLDETSGFFEQNEPLLLSTSIINFEKIFHHWVHRRYVTQRHPVTNMTPGRPIAAPLRVDDISTNLKQDDSDPYICFRKREIRSQRKHTKRVDLVSLDKLRKLHADLVAARNLFEDVGSREEVRRQLLTMDTAFFEKRTLVRKLKKAFGVLDTDENKKKKSRRTAEDSRPSSIKIKIRNPSTELLDIKSPADSVSEETRIADQVRRRKADDEVAGFIDLTEDPVIPPNRPGCKFWESVLPATIFYAGASHLPTPEPDLSATSIKKLEHNLFNHQCIFHGRRRIGRGGRLCFDRRFDLAQEKREPTDVESERLQSWKFDSPLEHEFGDTVVEMEDTLRNVAYRAFYLSPVGDDIQKYLTKPTYPDHIAPKPTADPLANKGPIPAYEVIRNASQVAGTDPLAANGATTVAATKKKTAPKAHKKPPPILDERAQKLKNMLESSRSQAQQAQLFKTQLNGAGNPTNIPQPNNTIATPATPLQNGSNVGVTSAVTPIAVPAGLGSLSPNPPTSGNLNSANVTTPVILNNNNSNSNSNAHTQFSMLPPNQQIMLRQQAMAMMSTNGHNSMQLQLQQQLFFQQQQQQQQQQQPQHQQQQQPTPTQLLMAFRQMQNQALAVGGVQNLPQLMQQQYYLTHQRIRMVMAQAQMNANANNGGMGAAGGNMIAGMAGAGGNVGGGGGGSSMSFGTGGIVTLPNGQTVTSQQFMAYQYQMMIKQKAAMAAYDLNVAVTAANGNGGGNGNIQVAGVTNETNGGGCEQSALLHS
ncbi:Enhancer of polycomb-like protein 1 [Physocladia obscura]|uniref:Enhancer of polycomb-like protein n=1 Tax=Physocladia obscura TaxID=109957 RepID=A0AAD5T8C6_9FUNG|nr:Enhancer of polycomb-like protein 1 [Physocladia obscura]